MIKRNYPRISLDRQSSYRMYAIKRKLTVSVPDISVATYNNLPPGNSKIPSPVSAIKSKKKQNIHSKYDDLSKEIERIKNVKESYCIPNVNKYFYKTKVTSPRRLRNSILKNNEYTIKERSNPSRYIVNNSYNRPSIFKNH